MEEKEKEEILEAIQIYEEVGKEVPEVWREEYRLCTYLGEVYTQEQLDEAVKKARKEAFEESAKIMKDFYNIDVVKDAILAFDKIKELLKNI